MRKGGSCKGVFSKAHGCGLPKAGTNSGTLVCTFVVVWAGAVEVLSFPAHSSGHAWSASGPALTGARNGWEGMGGGPESGIGPVCVAVGGCDRAEHMGRSGKDKMPCAAWSVLRLKKTLQHGCKSVVFYCVWISSLAGKTPSPYCQEFRARSMEHEYILRVVQRAGEKAVNCLKSRGRQRPRFCCCGGQSSEGQECWKLLSCASSRALWNTGISHSCQAQGMWEHSEDMNIQRNLGVSC